MSATKAEIQKRVEEIADLRVLGATATNVRQYAVEQGWGVSERNVYRYIAEADKLVAKAVDKNRNKLLNFHRAARRALYARCMAVSDYGNAARVLKDEAELFGLYPPKEVTGTHKHTGADGGDIIVRTIEVVHQTGSNDDNPDAPTNPTDDGGNAGGNAPA